MRELVEGAVAARPALFTGEGVGGTMIGVAGCSPR